MRSSPRWGHRSLPSKTLPQQRTKSPQEERRAKGREINDAMRKDVRAVLTADQQKAFDEKMPAGGPGGGKGGKKKEG